MNATAADAGPLYETLSRWQWRRGRRARAHGEGLELRKRLRAPAAGADGPIDGARGLDEWLFGRLDGRPAARVLDLGCGFGASAQRWARLGGGAVLGVTQSPFQVARATEQAERAGLGARVRFVRQEFAAPIAGPFDVALAIEAFGHAHDLDATLANVRRALAPGGVFVWVEDLLRAAAPGDADVAQLAACWSSPPLRTRTAARDALQRAGLRPYAEFDLTAQVPFATPLQLATRQRRLQRVRTLLPFAAVRRLVAAFAGGTALERLYARGAACYVVVMSERPPEPA